MKICWLDNAVSQTEINSLSAIGGEYVGAGNIPPLADILYAKSQQVGFLTWTVNDPDNMMKLMSKGIKGIITDDPHEMIAVKTYMGIGDGGLMAYWDFDETTGATAFDSSGNNNVITLNGCSRPAGIANNALAFNGSTDYATVPSSASLDISKAALSISCWVKLDLLPSAMTGSFGPVFDSDQDAYILYLDKANSELRFKVKDDDGDVERPGIPESMLSIGQWIHIAGVYNGDEAMIYMNGQLADHHYNTALDNLSPGQQARLGENGGDFFDGAVDELAIAGGLRGKALEVVKSDNNDMLVPAHSEMIIEGEVPLDEPMQTEGPFGEMFGYLGPQKEAVFWMNVTKITHRRAPWLMNSYTGMHRGYTTAPVEVLYERIMRRNIPNLIDFHYPQDMMGVSFVSIKKSAPGQGLEVGRIVANRVRICKVVVVVDHDMDVLDRTQMLFTIGSRWQPAMATEIIEKGTGNITDPSAVVSEQTSKIVIDATMQWPEEGGPSGDYAKRNRALLEELAPDALAQVDAAFGGALRSWGKSRA